MSNLQRGEGLVLANAMSRCFDDPTFAEISRGFKLASSIALDLDVCIVANDVTVFGCESHHFCFSDPDAIAEMALQRDQFTHAPHSLRVDQDMQEPSTRRARYIRHVITRTPEGFVDSLACFSDPERTHQNYRFADQLLGPASVIALANAIDAVRLGILAGAAPIRRS